METGYGAQQVVMKLRVEEAEGAEVGVGRWQGRSE